ncbi:MULTISPECIES: HGxxPAAW family protein [unclassified Arthrobacter]|uniref:HGxxPAAW family protein n=1 Tax=unclassified Arthrobacter TaxID=235627 RepID=UPI000CE4B8A0|nr:MULTISPECIES: HGxxPAAW family protein [unclassified Arthrobacter]
MSNKPSAAVSVYENVDHSVELGHGNSPAAWSSVLVMLVGALVACIAFVIGAEATLVFWIGVAVIAVGVILGPVLKAAGYGVGGSKLQNNGH